MNKEEFDISQELEQMRHDYAVLKERFDKQQIINEQLMENAMKKDVGRMFLSKKTAPVGVAIAILAVILSYVQGMAWWVTLSLIIFTVIFFPAVYWVYKGVREDEIYNGDILSTAETLRRFKKRYIAMESGICIFFFAFVIVATIFMTSMNISTELMWRRGILIVLLCLGTLTFEYYYAKRILNACDDIIGRLKMKDE